MADYDPIKKLFIEGLEKPPDSFMLFINGKVTEEQKVRITKLESEAYNRTLRDPPPCTVITRFERGYGSSVQYVKDPGFKDHLS
jgi:hypothetical protein